MATFIVFILLLVFFFEVVLGVFIVAVGVIDPTSGRPRIPYRWEWGAIFTILLGAALVVFGTSHLVSAASIIVRGAS